MAKLIVPVFLPHQGCPYRCVFCDQVKISGRPEREDRLRLGRALRDYLFSRPREELPSDRELAFYGGTFTGLPVARQEWFLERARSLRARGWIEGVRVSTHPDWIDPARLDRLRRFGVGTVELGVQSLDETVLERAGRGGSTLDLPSGVANLRARGFRVGMQLMAGLPGDTAATFLASVDGVIRLAPDFVRIYPALVVKHTELHRLYLHGTYRPWTLARAVPILAEGLARFQNAGIPVVRLGLHPEPSLLANQVAGPYHPALKSLVLSRLRLKEMVRWFRKHGICGDRAVFRVPLREVSHYTGHRRENIDRLAALFGLKEIRFLGDPECRTPVRVH